MSDPSMSVRRAELAHVYIIATTVSGVRARGLEEEWRLLLTFDTTRHVPLAWRMVASLEGVGGLPHDGR